jgi:histidyl-tRNA synthetase
MKIADRLGAKYVYIIGGDEINKGYGILKNMGTGEQKNIAFDSLEEIFSLKRERGGE